MLLPLLMIYRCPDSQHCYGSNIIVKGETLLANIECNPFESSNLIISYSCEYEVTLYIPDFIWVRGKSFSGNLTIYGNKRIIFKDCMNGVGCPVGYHYKLQCNSAMKMGGCFILVAFMHILILLR